MKSFDQVFSISASCGIFLLNCPSILFLVHSTVGTLDVIIVSDICTPLINFSSESYTIIHQPRLFSFPLTLLNTDETLYLPYVSLHRVCPYHSLDGSLCMVIIFPVFLSKVFGSLPFECQSTYLRKTLHRCSLLKVFPFYSIKTLVWTSVSSYTLA